MDAIDIRIVRELGFQPFASWPHPPDQMRPAALAKLLGLGVDAVKERLRRLHREGIIRGYEIYPNFRHFASAVTSYRFRLANEAQRARAVQDAERVDGVCGVIGFMGSDLCVDVCHSTPQELDRRLSLLSSLMGDNPPDGFFDYAMPAVVRPLSPLDWRIIQALRGNAQRSLDEVAEDIGVTGRTVKRRYERMVQEGAFDVVANFDPGALRNYVLVLLLLTLRGPVAPGERAAVLGSFDGRWFHAWTPPGSASASLFVAVLAPSFGDVEALRREAQSLSGVERAECLVPVHLHANMGWIDEAIRHRAGPDPDARAKIPLTTP